MQLRLVVLYFFSYVYHYYIVSFHGSYFGRRVIETLDGEIGKMGNGALKSGLKRRIILLYYLIEYRSHTHVLYNF